MLSLMPDMAAEDRAEGEDVRLPLKSWRRCCTSYPHEHLNAEQEAAINFKISGKRLTQNVWSLAQSEISLLAF